MSTTDHRSPSPVAATAIATLCTTAAVLPVFLFGGLASLIRVDVPFGPRALGMVASAFFAAAALASVPGGRLAERIGATRTLRIGILLAAGSLAGVATIASRPWHIMVLMLAAGASNGLSQPAANLALTRLVGRQYHGIVFGIKQAAIPMATLIAGVAVPVAGLTVGWRWAFGIASLTTLPLLVALLRVMPRHPTTIALSPPESPVAVTARAAPRRLAGRRLLPVAIAGGCGTAAANTLGAFYVESAVVGGLSPATAGTLLAAGSIMGIATRLALGWLADRVRVDQFKVIGGMIAGGVLGYVALGHLDGPAWLLPATILAFGAGWGWPGLLHLAVVRENTDAPAAASGFAQTGLYLGGVIGPLVFGWTAQFLGYPTAWSVLAGAAAVGSVLLLTRHRPPGAHDHNGHDADAQDADAHDDDGNNGDDRADDQADGT